MQTMQAKFHGRNESTSNRLQPRSNKTLDVQSQLREMW
jgi:hypothetical protein